MEFHDLPTRLPRRLYDDAVTAYVARVHERASAIYQIGNVAYPGLSDIDLLVVPRGPRRDNGAWFSVFVRLPAELRRPFLHEPCVVPPGTEPAIRYTTHARRRLLAGADVLRELVPIQGEEANAALLLEGYANYDTFLRRRRRRRRVAVRHLVAVASSLRFSLALLDGLLETALASAYAEAIDAARRDFVEGRIEGQELGQRVWERYEATLSQAERTLVDWLPLGRGEAPAHFACEFLHGRRELAGLDGERLRRRRELVRRHQVEVRRMGFRYGDLFYRQPYLALLRRLDGRRRPRALIDLVSRRWYGLRRRLTERHSRASGGARPPRG